MTADQIISGVFLTLGAFVFARLAAQARKRATGMHVRQLEARDESDVSVEGDGSRAPA